MSRTAFGVNLGFRKNTDGSISFGGPIQMPTFRVSAVGYKTEAKLLDKIGGMTLGMIGSSTTVKCTSTFQLLSGVTALNDHDDGPLMAAKDRFGIPLDAVANVAVGGISAPAIYASLDPMLAANPGLDWVWLHYGANDMQFGQISPQQTAENYMRPSVLKCFAAGAKVIAVIPHTTSTATAGTIGFFEEYEARIRAMADEYSGRMVVWSHYKHCSQRYGGVTPAALLDTTGVHLSVEGAWVAGGAGEEFAQLVGPLDYCSPKRFGTPINSDPDCLATASFAVTNGTIALASRSWDGRGGVDVTSSAAGTVFVKADAQVVAGKKYRVVADVEVIADGVTTLDVQARGAAFGDRLVQSGGWTYAGDPYSGYMPIGSRRRKFSNRFVPPEVPTSRIYVRFEAGAAGAKVRIRGLGLVEVA